MKIFNNKHGTLKQIKIEKNLKTHFFYNIYEISLRSQIMHIF